MTNEPKRRGRPKGSEKDDSKILAKIADLLVANSGMKPTTAMRCLKTDASDAEIHRWQDKWRQRKDGLMAEAIERDFKRRSATASPPQMSGADVISIASEIRNNPVYRLAGDIQNSPEMRFAREMQGSEAYRLAMEIKNNPTMLLASQIYNSPGMRLARQMQAEWNSPVMRAARGLL